MANYFSFKGRLNRHPYWMLTLKLGMFASLCLAMLLFVTMGGLTVQNFLNFSDDTFSIISFSAAAIFLFGLAAHGIAAMSIAVRRLHDRNLSGLWAAGFPVLYMYSFPGPHNSIVLELAGLVLTIFYLIVLGILKGTPGKNRFGPDPLPAPQPNPAEVIE